LPMPQKTSEGKGLGMEARRKFRSRASSFMNGVAVRSSGINKLVGRGRKTGKNQGKHSLLSSERGNLILVWGGKHLKRKGKGLSGARGASKKKRGSLRRLELYPIDGKGGGRRYVWGWGKRGEKQTEKRPWKRKEGNRVKNGTEGKLFNFAGLL